jgi:putative ABC transport system permease protein
MTQRFVVGSPASLRRPDAIAIDEAAFAKLWPGAPLDVGHTLELNDRRAVVTAVSNASAQFVSSGVIYTRYSQAIRYVPSGRNQLSFVLARAAADHDPREVARAISERTGLRAYTSASFSVVTIVYYLANTGIPLNFGVVIALGFVVGIAIIALTFSMFVSDNIRHFATLKAVGAGDRWVTRLVFLQAGFVGVIGYSVGLALAVLFESAIDSPTAELRGFYTPWWLALGVAIAIAFVISVAIVTGLRRVLLIDPALAFRG